MKLYALVLEYGDYDEDIVSIYTDEIAACLNAQYYCKENRSVVHVVAFRDGSMVSYDSEVIAVYGKE